MLLANHSIYQSIPRRCLGYGVGTAIVGLTLFQRERIGSYNAIIIEKTSPVYQKVKDYLSAIIRYNRDLCHSLYFKSREFQYGLTAIAIGGLTVLAYKNQDKIVIVPASLVYFARYNLLALKAKLVSK